MSLDSGDRIHFLVSNVSVPSWHVETPLEKCMMPADPENPDFENFLNLSAEEREQKSIDIAENNSLEEISDLIADTYKSLCLLPLANGILPTDILEPGISNLSAKRQIEIRAFRIKRGM